MMNSRCILKLLCVLALVCLSGWMQAQVDDNQPAAVRTELAMVDIDLGSHSILVTYPEGRTEQIQVKDDGRAAELFLSRDRQMLAVFQRLYNDGWMIESELTHTALGRAIYILKRARP